MAEFAEAAGKSASEIVRSAIIDVMRGRVAGYQRRKDIASLRRSTNLMIEAFKAKPIDVPKLKEIAFQVRKDAVRVLE